MSDTPQTVTANGRKINARLPVSLHGFLESQGMLLAAEDDAGHLSLAEVPGNPSSGAKGK